ncbi:MAG: carbon-nitrogen hydrolase family protein [Anaerolineae bacterium]|nr:carbon-nitrogen hydrolase family protein [Anaerolineae bacterium]
MRIALASPRVATSIADGLAQVQTSIAEAAAQAAKIVCFPEAYLPGLRGVDIEVCPYDEVTQAQVQQAVSGWARQYGIAVIMGMEQISAAGRRVAAYVFDAQGQCLGHQCKTQIAPSEDAHYVPGSGRQLFEIENVKFGIAICHEAWRYPETVRWATTRGAQIVFQPQHTGSDHGGAMLTQWAAADNPYYEKAMLMRSIENTVFFASVNYGLRYPESATCVVNPAGECIARLPYGQAGVLVCDLNLAEATRLIAQRFAPERY